MFLLKYDIMHYVCITMPRVKVPKRRFYWKLGQSVRWNKIRSCISDCLPVLIADSCDCHHWRRWEEDWNTEEKPQLEEKRRKSGRENWLVGIFFFSFKKDYFFLVFVAAHWIAFFLFIYKAHELIIQYSGKVKKIEGYFHSFHQVRWLVRKARNEV